MTKGNMKYTSEQKELIKNWFVEHIVGTCSKYEGQMAEEMTEEFKFEVSEDDMEFCECLDEVMFNCAICGWWCGTDDFTHKETDDLVCTQCGEYELD